MPNAKWQTKRQSAFLRSQTVCIVGESTEASSRALGKERRRPAPGLAQSICTGTNSGTRTGTDVQCEQPICMHFRHFRWSKIPVVLQTVSVVCSSTKPCCAWSFGHTILPSKSRDDFLLPQGVANRQAYNTRLQKLYISLANNGSGGEKDQL